jgi:uncharacterized protein (TIGR00251 family)
LIRATAAGVELDIRVIPRAKKSGFGGVRDEAIVIRLAAPPVDNAANDALIAFLSDALDCPRRAIRVLTGERGRRKRVAIDGMSVGGIRRLLYRTFGTAIT